MGASHKPTTALRAKVSALASFGIPHEKIAKYIGVCYNTLRKYYEPELQNALVDKIVAVANALYHNAVDNNNTSAQIFFLKTRAGWRETDKEEKSDKPDIGKIQIEVINTKEN